MAYPSEGRRPLPAAPEEGWDEGKGATEARLCFALTAPGCLRARLSRAAGEVESVTFRGSCG